MELIIQTAFRLVVLIMAYVAGKYLIPFVQTVTMQRWALTFVKSAEAIIKTAKSGAEKRELVSKWISDKAKVIGVVLSEEEVRALLEEAVNIMNKESGK